MPVEIRTIQYEELPELLNLYKQLHPDDPEVYGHEELNTLWDQIINDPCLHYIVMKDDGKIVSTCTLAIVKNLTRGLRPYGLIENVITHKEYRKRGCGTRVLNKAVEIAKNYDCYKVMLMTSSKEENVLRFYEKAGFEKDKKIGFALLL